MDEDENIVLLIIQMLLTGIVVFVTIFLIAFLILVALSLPSIV